MQFITTLDKLNIKEKTAVSIGKFDGLHRGHRSLIEDINDFKEKNSHSSTIIMTFSGISKTYLSSSAEKYSLVEKTGADYFLELPFDLEIRNLSAQSFVETVLLNKLNMSYLSVGEDFQFGSNRTGNIAYLQDCSQKYGFGLKVHSKLKYQGHEISSTYIKNKIKESEIVTANEMLGYPYFIRGKVLHGTKIGSTKLGYPTINISPENGKVLPKNGVYISRVLISGNLYNAISNIGYKPTVSSEHILGIESFLLNFNGDCYDKTVEVQLLDFVREERKFSSIDELKNEITNNIVTAQKFFAAL